MSRRDPFAWCPETVRKVVIANGYGGGNRRISRAVFRGMAWAYEHNSPHGPGPSSALVLGNAREMPHAFWQLPEDGRKHGISEIMRREWVPCSAELARSKTAFHAADLADALGCDAWLDANGDGMLFRADLCGMPVLFTMAKVPAGAPGRSS